MQTFMYFSRILVKAEVITPGALHSPKDITVNSQRPFTLLRWYRNLMITGCNVEGRKDQRCRFSRNIA